MESSNPYDECPYRSLPIEWTAPERLALASLLHGGPRAPLRSYRVLEIGCGDGSNLLPQAYYRTHSMFVGIDNSRTAIERAEGARASLGLSNIEFRHLDVLDSVLQLDGQFDYIIAHGLFSWIPDCVRNAMLRLGGTRLREGGLLYVNYNSYPGWRVRGLVREFLMAQTREAGTLFERARTAQEVSARVVGAIPVGPHPYSHLLADEFRFVCENDPSYVAHEYLSPENHAYWRSEFVSLTEEHGLEFVADADFNYGSGRLPDGLPGLLHEQRLTGRTLDDTVDLLCYRQLHSPILTRAPLVRASATVDEWSSLTMASCLRPATGESPASLFKHSSGYEVEARQTAMSAALECLFPLWPRGRRLDSLFPTVSDVIDDVRLLHRNGLVELRSDPFETLIDAENLHRLEDSKGYHTTAFHTVHTCTVPGDEPCGE